MDKIKELILERVQHSQILKIKCEKTLDYQELYQAKKAEKIRQIKENELIEALFNFGQASKCERQLFEVHSSEVMSSLNYQFNYKPKNKGLFSDIAEMYILFFDSIKLEARVEEIRIIAKYNLYQNFPFLCMLFKWLIEISRKIFVDVMAQAKIQAANDKQRKVQGVANNMRNGNNISSSQEHLKSNSHNSKNQGNLTATTASQNTQESFATQNNENNSRCIKLNPVQLEIDNNKKISNEDYNIFKKKGKLGLRGAVQQQFIRQNKENTSEGSKQKNTNIINLNNTVIGITSRSFKESQQQQHQEINRYQQQDLVQEKYCNTQPNQSEFSPQLSAQNYQVLNNKSRSLRISNSYIHKHSRDDIDIQSQTKEITHIMSATQNFQALNLSDPNDDDEDDFDNYDEEDTQMMMIRQTQSQILKGSNAGKSSNNLINQQDDAQIASSNMIGSSHNSKNQSINQQNFGSQKQKMANEFLKNQGKPNLEKLKRRKRELVFSNIKECIADVEFVVQKCSDYLMNFYLKLIYQRNVQVKNTIDDYRVKHMQNFRNTFAKLDPGLIYTEQDKINAEQQLKNSLSESNPLSQSVSNIDQLQKSSSQLLQDRSESSQANNVSSSNNNNSNQSRRTCSTLSPIFRPIGSERKSQRTMLETSKSNNFSLLNQNLQNNNHSQIVIDKDKKRVRTLSQIGTFQGQTQQQQDKSLSPLSQNIPFNQQFSKDFAQLNSVQIQQFQFLPQYIQRNSPEIRRQNIKNSKYTNCIVPTVKNFDTSEIEPNTFNANHIINSKHSNILKGKQSKFQKNLIMMKLEKNSSQPIPTQFQQFNLDLLSKKGGDDGKYINMIQNNTLYQQNSNILKKIHTNDLSLSNIILGSANKNQQTGINNSMLDENSNGITNNHNLGSGSSCIILTALNNTEKNGQDTYSKSAVKSNNYPSSNQDSLVFEDEFARIPPSYHLKGKYRPPKNPKILLQKIQNNFEEQIPPNPSLINNQIRNLSGGKQTSFYNNTSQQNALGGPNVSSFQNDITQFDIQMKFNQTRKPQQSIILPDNLSGITALKNRKVLTQPDEVMSLTPNEKLTTASTNNQQHQSRSTSGKVIKDELIQKQLQNKFYQNKQNLTQNINTNNNYNTNTNNFNYQNLEIQKQIGNYYQVNNNTTNNKYNSNMNNSNNNNNNSDYIPFRGFYNPFNQLNNDNSIFPFLKDAVAQQQDNLQKYF